MLFLLLEALVKTTLNLYYALISPPFTMDGHMGEYELS